MLRNASKLFQRRLYTYLNSWSGFTLFLVLCYLLLSTIIGRFSNSCSLRGLHSHCSDRDPIDNIAFRSLDNVLKHEPFDVVYTWVNGSDPRWKRKKDAWSGKGAATQNSAQESFNNSASNETTTFFNNTTTGANETAIDPDDTMSSNRYRDSEELRFSLRSLVKNAPWIRRIYIVTDNQIPYWLNLESKRLTVISHEDIFANKSHLPVFSSPAIEANLHRIPGLSKKFIYFNDDVFLGAKVLPEDFISLHGAQRLVMSWDVPKCAPGCSDSWIGDGFCDKACNVSACNFDFPDCINGTNAQSTYSNSRPSSSLAMCAKGCPDTWLADKICDQRCKNEECGWDLGDCGLDLVTLGFPGVAIDRSNARILETTSSSAGTGAEFGYGIGPGDGSYQYGAADMMAMFDYTTNPPTAGEDEGEDPVVVLSEDASVPAETETEGESTGLGETETSPEHRATSNTVNGNETVSAAESSHHNTHQHLHHHHSHRHSHSHHFQSPALTVEYGTTAVYFDLSFLPCMYSTNATCVPEQAANFLYERSEHDDESGNLVHSATLMSRHHLLVVLLYHGQDLAPEVNWIVYDVKFTVAVLNALTSETATATFSLRVFTAGHEQLKHPAELVPSGMAMLPQAHAHSCLPDFIAPPAAPATVAAVTGAGNATFTTLPSGEISVQKADILTHPYRTIKDEEGAILSLELSIRENSTSLQSLPSARLAVAYTVTPIHGPAHRIILPGCASLLEFRADRDLHRGSAAVGVFEGFCTAPHCTVCPATFDEVLEIAHNSANRFASYVASKGPQRSPRFQVAPSSSTAAPAAVTPSQPPLDVSASSDASNMAAVPESAAAVEEPGAAENAVVVVKYVTRMMHMKVPMPVGWSAVDSSRWYHVHVQMLVLPDTQGDTDVGANANANAGANSQTQLLMNQWHPVPVPVPIPIPAAPAGDQNPLSSLGEQLLCVSAAVRWGRDVNLTALAEENITMNTGSAANATIASLSSHNPTLVEAPPSETSAPLEADAAVMANNVAEQRSDNSSTVLHQLDASVESAESSVPTIPAGAVGVAEGDVDTESAPDSSSPPPSRRHHRRLAASTNRLLITVVTNVLTSVRTALLSLQTNILTTADTFFSLVLGASSTDTSADTTAAAEHRRRLEDTYALSLVHVNRIYNKEFGAEGRKVPAHVPHMMDREYLKEMQARWPEQWNATSSHRFRSTTDMQYSFSYYYYLANRAKVHPPDLLKYVAAVLDTDRDGRLNDNEFRSLAAVAKGSNAPPSEEYIATLRECIANSSNYLPHYSEEVRHTVPLGKVHKSFTLQMHPTIAQALNCTELTEALQKNVNWGAIQPSHVFESDKELVAFEMIGDNYTISMSQLDSVRARQSKFVCINDNMVNPTPELEKALRSFYESFFPEPCVFELAPGVRNPTLYLDEYHALKKRQHVGHRVLNYVQAVQVQGWRWLRSGLQAVLLPLADRTVDALSEHPVPVFPEETARHDEVYVNGLRSDIHRQPAYHHPKAHQEQEEEEGGAMVLSRNVLLFSVVGVVGFALLRILSKRPE